MTVLYCTNRDSSPWDLYKMTLAVLIHRRRVRARAHWWLIIIHAWGNVPGEIERLDFFSNTYFAHSVQDVKQYFFLQRFWQRSFRYDHFITVKSYFDEVKSFKSIMWNTRERVLKPAMIICDLDTICTYLCSIVQQNLLIVKLLSIRHGLHIIWGHLQVKSMKCGG